MMKMAFGANITLRKLQRLKATQKTLSGALIFIICAGEIHHKTAPNAAHKALARLEAEYPGEVVIVTQNIDVLHEAAGVASDHSHAWTD